MGRAVLQYNHCTCDTALGAGQRVAGAQARRGRARGAQATGAREWAGAQGAAGARQGRGRCATGSAAGPAGCGLGALNLFLT